MSAIPDLRDVMQVCYNGHVITDLLKSCPQLRQSTCDQCGAATLDHCLTCGAELPGAVPTPGLVGSRRAPERCLRCGAPFPWTQANPAPAPDDALTPLTKALRRLPRVIRELRNRQTDRPGFRIEDRRDLEDLLRALLPLWFDQVWPQSRTPSYAAQTQTDFLLTSEQIALTVKLVGSSINEQQLASQWQEDISHYAAQPNCRTLLGVVYDPLGAIPDPRRQETAWSRTERMLKAQWLIAETS